MCLRVNKLYNRTKELCLSLPPRISATYIQNKNNVKFGHLNINSVQNKINPIAEALSMCIFDVLCLQETKLDNNFPIGQFYAHNCTAKMLHVIVGGLMMSYDVTTLRHVECVCWKGFQRNQAELKS